MTKSQGASYFDVIVVGASVAGSFLSYLLGREGLRVALIDKTRFPRNKPCGEGLSSTGTQILAEEGLLPEARSIACATFDEFEIINQGRTTCIPQLSDSSLPGLSIARRDFDSFLISRALATGNIVSLLGAAVIEINARADSAQATTTSGAVEAACLVVATGAHSGLANQFGGRPRTTNADRFGAALHVSGKSPSQRVQIHVKEQGEIYVTPSRKDLYTVALLGTKSFLRSNVLAIRSQSCAQEWLSQCSLPGRIEEDPLGSGPLSPGLRRAAFGRVALIGDAVESFDPIGGMGMTHALGSARLLARELLLSAKGRCEPSQAMTRYARQRDVFARRIRLFSKAAYFTVRSKIAARGVSLASRVKAFHRPLVRIHPTARSC